MPEAEVSTKPGSEVTSRNPDDDEDEYTDEDSFDLVPVRSIFDNFPNLFGVTQSRNWWSG